MVGPMARPGARGLGPGLGLKYEIVLRAGPGLDIIVAGRAGPGPHNSICGPGPGQVCTTAAGPGRAWASNHVCGPGLGLDFRPVQGPSWHTVQRKLFSWILEFAQQAEQVQKYYHSVLKRLISITKVSCERGLAFRGEDRQ